MMDHFYISSESYGVMISGVEHRTGMKRYKSPPRNPESKTIAYFAENLRLIIPEKIKELMIRQDEVLLKYKDDIARIEALAKSGEIDKTTEYFGNYLAELDFVEYVVINKWLRYYLRLATKIEPQGSWIRQAKELVDMEELIGRAKQHPIEEMYDGDLRVNGQRLIGRCPFHNERTPSFTIFREDNHFYCFGCNKTGDAIDFYMLKNKVESLKEAVKALS